MAEEKYFRKITEVDGAESIDEGDTLILIRSGKAFQIPVSEVGEKVSTAEIVEHVDNNDTLALIRSGTVYRVNASEVNGEKVSTAPHMTSYVVNTSYDYIPLVREGSVYRIKPLEIISGFDTISYSANEADTIPLIRNGNVYRIKPSEIISGTSSTSTINSSDKIPLVRNGQVYQINASKVVDSNNGSSGGSATIYMLSNGSFYMQNSVTGLYGDLVSPSSMRSALQSGVIRYYKYHASGKDYSINSGEGLGTILSYKYDTTNKALIYCTIGGKDETYTMSGTGL